MLLLWFFIIVTGGFIGLAAYHGFAQAVEEGKADMFMRAFIMVAVFYGSWMLALGIITLIHYHIGG